MISDAQSYENWMNERGAEDPLTEEERAEAEAHGVMMYRLSVLLMRLDGNDGDPHHLIWCGGAVPEPWGDAWQKYEPQAEAVVEAIGEASARAMVDALLKVFPEQPDPAATPQDQGGER